MADTTGVEIQLDAVTKRYPGQSAPAVDEFTMTIEPGQTTIFVGPSARRPVGPSARRAAARRRRCG